LNKTLVPAALTALFAALIAAGTFIVVPLPFSPVPLVLQNFFALLAGMVLGPVRGGAAVGLYLLVGALGAPVFSGASGGVAHLLGPTGGYLLGYLAGALTAGLIAGKPQAASASPYPRLALAALAGLLAIYIPGLARLHAVLGADWPKTVSVGALPFIPGDLAKGFLAVVVARRLRRVAADHLHG